MLCMTQLMTNLMKACLQIIEEFFSKLGSKQSLCKLENCEQHNGIKNAAMLSFESH